LVACDWGVKIFIKKSLLFAWFLVSVGLVRQASAGPPYITDDPATTEYSHFETYVFASGTAMRDGTSGAAGIDFSYGASSDLQLTAVVPIAYDSPRQGPGASGLGNIELAAKYRIAHQDSFGWDVSFFPRVFLPSASRNVAGQHASYLLPIWVEKEWGRWSTFGGGGYFINRGGDSRDFQLFGWALTHQILPKLQIGAEIYHRSADTRGGLPTTGVNAGLRYDLNDHYHLLGSIGPGIQNASETNEHSWYLALLFTL
jgi:Putative MetA-pathway of phenol degradation